MQESRVGWAAELVILDAWQGGARPWNDMHVDQCADGHGLNVDGDRLVGVK